jgi:AcrR family transcriptional regulator
MATALFIERGYHAVTTAEIAERAAVSVPTLFNYFPTKESLVFDEDSEREARLVETVENRGEAGIQAALLAAGLANIDAIIKDGQVGIRSRRPFHPRCLSPRPGNVQPQGVSARPVQNAEGRMG